MADRLLAVLQHALGRDQYGHGTDYRNHFCVSEGPDFETCQNAVANKLMVRHEPRAISGGDYIFCVTDKGKAHIAEHSPVPPKLSRAKRRYLRWLHISDVCDIKFGDWLKTPEARND